MSRTSAETLRKTVTAELITYLGAGRINTTQLAQTIDYRDQNIESLEELKRLRFVLHEPVLKYIEQVPKWLRRIKTDHRTETQTVQGEVRGRIDWPQTTQIRSQAGFTDPSQFAITSPVLQYDLPENRVIKKLLSEIMLTVNQEIAGTTYDWSQWDKPAIDRLTTTVTENRYLNELPDADAINITNRDLKAAKQSRHELYRRSEQLYRLLDDLLNDRYEQPQVQSVLKETVIAPTKNHKLFELFCLFAYVEQLQKAHSGIQLHPIRSGMGPFAVLQGDTQQIEVYYDQTGPLTFRESFDSLGPVDELPETIQRHVEAVERHSKLAEQFLKRKNQDAFYEGRPDLLVLKYRTDEGKRILEHVTIGEFKYTKSEETFSQGLRELLEYIQFAKSESEYLIDNGSHNQRLAIRGILCTDGVATEQDTVDTVTHYTSETLKSMLQCH
ncbi:hypothetical protein HUG10_10590 [Halorarum halophilum]|uniref:Uncharacterized protein n=1 Tax=Halorarum halophilum TaxID=2743090 RepID=A0A7D5KM33_9EURY|nr:hypothetical protein [Halobaculum halophilum]QLG27975.1 hypothetical protein HUG10_10590 [Halobaculum halophilum]